MMNRLGIIDWGIGGIGVYKLLRERLGDIPVTYFSDTGCEPYGRMARSDLVSRLNAVIGHLMAKRNVTHLVIGCNAASTVIPMLVNHEIPIVGMIEPAIEYVSRLNPERLGLIGGRRTVVSGVYRRGFAKRGITVRQRIAQPLSAMIEQGDTYSPHLRDKAREILKPIGGCSHILLACTHYPAIANLISELISPDTVLVDPAAELIGVLQQWNFVNGGDTEFVTTGDPEAMRSAARNAFGVAVEQPRRVTI